MNKEVILYTDGACSGNPGPGGWAALLLYGEHKLELSGGEALTTNNRMELKGVIEGLRRLKQSCTIQVCSDSSYVIHAFQKGWVRNWQRNGWITSQKKPVENQDLWLQLLEAMEPHQIQWVKVRGHQDNPYNNRCDEMARAAIKAMREGAGQ